MTKPGLESKVDEWISRTTALAGSAYFVANSGPFGKGFAAILGAYAIWDAYIYPTKEEELEGMMMSTPPEKKKEAEVIANKSKENLTNIQAPFQCLCALYGLMYAHQGYIRDDLGAGFAGVAISAGYLGLFFKSNRHIAKLRVERQAIYSETTGEKNGRSKRHKTS